MSIHAAKGLEFKVVFVSALQRGADSSSPVIVFAKESAQNGATQPPENRSLILFTPLSSRRENSAKKPEENRLLYVAMTRAEERLVFDLYQGQELSRLAEVSGINRRRRIQRGSSHGASAALEKG